MMLTFKQFLAQQEDNIDEMGAIASYNEYKAEFKRKQVEEFFEKHKDEDWYGYFQAFLVSVSLLSPLLNLQCESHVLIYYLKGL